MAFIAINMFSVGFINYLIYGIRIPQKVYYNIGFLLYKMYYCCVNFVCCCCLTCQFFFILYRPSKNHISISIPYSLFVTFSSIFINIFTVSLLPCLLYTSRFPLVWTAISKISVHFSWVVPDTEAFLSSLC